MRKWLISLTQIHSWRYNLTLDIVNTNLTTVFCFSPKYTPSSNSEKKDDDNPSEEPPELKEETKDEEKSGDTPKVTDNKTSSVKSYYEIDGDEI